MTSCYPSFPSSLHAPLLHNTYFWWCGNVLFSQGTRPTYVRQTYPGSAAAAKGLKRGDVLISVAGRPVQQMQLHGVEQMLGDAVRRLMDGTRGQKPLSVRFVLNLPICRHPPSCSVWSRPSTELCTCPLHSLPTFTGCCCLVIAIRLLPSKFAHLVLLFCCR